MYSSPETVYAFALNHQSHAYISIYMVYMNGSAGHALLAGRQCWIYHPDSESGRLPRATAWGCIDVTLSGWIQDASI